MSDDIVKLAELAAKKTCWSVQSHRDAFQNGWHNGYKEGRAQAINDVLKSIEEENESGSHWEHADGTQKSFWYFISEKFNKYLK